MKIVIINTKHLLGIHWWGISLTNTGDKHLWNWSKLSQDFPFWIESINDEHLWNWIKLSMGFGLPILDKEDYWWTRNWTKLAMGFDFLLCLLAERVVGERQKQGSGCSTPSSNLNTVWHKSTRIQTHKSTNTNRMREKHVDICSSLNTTTRPCLTQIENKNKSIGKLQKHKYKGKLQKHTYKGKELLNPLIQS